MRAVILDGALRDDSFIGPVHDIAVEELKAKGWDVESITLRDTKINHCLGCFKCWTKTPGICTINDDARDIVRKAIQSDLVLMITPVTFGGYSSELKKAADRLIPILSPFFMKIRGEVHHKARYKKYPSLFGVGALDAADEERENVFKTLVARHALNAHSPQWGAEVIVNDQKQNYAREKVSALLVKAG